jgi:adenylylsulfate kinase
LEKNQRKNFSPGLFLFKRRHLVNNNLLRPGTIFITGISASGKSTLGKCLKKDMIDNGINNIQLIDGEDIRAELAKGGRCFGYTKDERNKVAVEIAHTALEHNKKGIICIVCSICHIRETRKQMRTIIGDIMEVYLDCPVSICAQRDHKGQYAKALQGLCDNFVGVAVPYEKSAYVDLVLYTGSDSVEKCSQLLFKAAKDFLKGEYVKIEEGIDLIKENKK